MLMYDAQLCKHIAYLLYSVDDEAQPTARWLYVFILILGTASSISVLEQYDWPSKAKPEPSPGSIQGSLPCNEGEKVRIEPREKYRNLHPGGQRTFAFSI